MTTRWPGDESLMPPPEPPPTVRSAAGRRAAGARADADGPGEGDPAGRPLGAGDDLDVALLQLHRLALAATVRAGNESSPAVTPTQIRVLTLLAGSPQGMPLSAVADALSVSPPSASRLCQRLVRDALAVRSAGPGHHILISLSPEAARLLRALNQARVAPFRRLVDALPPRRRTALAAELAELGRRASEQHGAW
jgi:DNA-binding MarR family transcriptional regulator